MKKIAIIGANEFQKKLICKANSMGYETHVFAWEDGAVGKEVANFFYPISIIEKDSILQIVKKIQIEGICSIASDLAMPTVNYIAVEMGLIGNTIECTELTTDKKKMRAELIKNGHPSPKYQAIKNIEELNKKTLKLPLIVKPKDRSGSRGINKVDSFIDLEKAIKSAQSVSFSDEIIVEEFVDGKEYSVEFISQNSIHKFLQITEKFTTGAPHFIEKAHLSPARLKEGYQKKIVDIVMRSLDTLGVQNGASHSEVKISSIGDIKIIEIAARMGGDFIGSDMVEISTGFDFLKSVIKTSVNEPIDSADNLNNNISLVKFIFDSKDIEEFEIIRNLFPHIIVEYSVSDNMIQVMDSSTRNGYFIMKIPNEDILNQVLQILKLNEID